MKRFLILLCLIMILSMFSIVVYADDADDGALVLDKWVEYDSENHSYLLNMTAYSTGVATSTARTVPTDIVIVFDHSGSMFRPLDSDVKITAADVMSNVDKASHYGYYIGRGYSSYVFIFYADDQWWYCDTYVSASVEWNHSFDMSNFLGTSSGNSNRKPMTDALWSRFEEYGIWQTRYGASYDAMMSFVNFIADADAHHRVAFVGFGGYTEDATALYNGADRILYNQDTISDVDYQQAFKNATAERDTLLASVNAFYTGYHQTCTSAGIDMANDIFANNPVTDRNRMVVLLSDGLPQNAHGIFDANAQLNTILNGVVNRAYETKNVHGADFYSLGTLSSRDVDAQTVLERASSNYPTATVWNQTDGKVSDGDYYLNVMSAYELQVKFEQIFSGMTGTSVTADITSYLQDVIADDFSLPDGVTVDDIQVMLADYTGLRDDAGLPLFGEHYAASDLAVSVDADTKTVQVTGFDYSTEYIVDDLSETSEIETNGRMLIVQVPIVISDSNLGGVYQSTNIAAKSGVFAPDGGVVGLFPEPHVDTSVEIKISMTVIGEGADMNREFDFSIVYTLFDGKSYQDVQGSGSNDSNWLQAIISDKEMDVSLTGNPAAGNSIVLSDIYPGSDLVISEINRPLGYVLNSVMYNGETYPAENNTVIIPADKIISGAEIVFVNERVPVPGTGIQIQKLIDFDGLLNGWVFEIMDENGNQIAGSPFTTDDDGLITVDSLLSGEYIITEILPDNSPYYSDMGLSHTITVTDGVTSMVSFLNHMTFGEITIYKISGDDLPLSDVTFLLECSKDGIVWNPVVYSKTPMMGSSSSSDIMDGCLTTDETGLISFTALDPRLQYRLSEMTCPNGYVLLSDYAYLGELSYDEDYIVELTVVNYAGYDLPATGEMSLIGVSLFGCFGLVCSLVGLVLILRRKKLTNM